MKEADLFFPKSTLFKSDVLNYLYNVGDNIPLDEIPDEKLEEEKSKYAKAFNEPEFDKLEHLNKLRFWINHGLPQQAGEEAKLKGYDEIKQLKVKIRATSVILKRYELKNEMASAGFRKAHHMQLDLVHDLKQRGSVK